MQAHERKNENEHLKRRLGEAEDQVFALTQEVTTVRSQVCFKNRESDDLRCKVVELKSRLTVRLALTFPYIPHNAHWYSD